MTSYVATGTATQVVVNYVTSTVVTTSTAEIFGGSNFTILLATIAGIAAIIVAIIAGRQILKKPKPPPPKPPEVKPPPTPIPTPPKPPEVKPPPTPPTISPRPLPPHPLPKVVSMKPLPQQIQTPVKLPTAKPATIEKAIESIGPEVRKLEQERLRVLTTLKNIDTQLSLLGKKVSDSIKKAEMPIAPELAKPKKPKTRPTPPKGGPPPE
jgi:hypothetical protein